MKLRSSALVFAKVGLQLVAERDEAQQFLRLKQIPLIAGIELVQMAAHILDGLVGRTVLYPCKIALHQPPLHQARGSRDLFAPQRERTVELGFERFALHVLLEQAIHKPVHLVVYGALHRLGQRDRSFSDRFRQGGHDFGGRQGENRGANTAGFGHGFLLAVNCSRHVYTKDHPAFGSIRKHIPPSNAEEKQLLSTVVIA